MGIIKEVMLIIASTGVVSVLLQTHLKRKKDLKTELRELEIKWVELTKEYYDPYYSGKNTMVFWKELDSCYTRIKILEKDEKMLTAMAAVRNSFPGQDSAEFEELSLEINNDPNFYHAEFYDAIDKVCMLIKI